MKASVFTGGGRGWSAQWGHRWLCGCSGGGQLCLSDRCRGLGVGQRRGIPGGGVVGHLDLWPVEEVFVGLRPQVHPQPTRLQARPSSTWARRSTTGASSMATARRPQSRSASSTMLTVSPQKRLSPPLPFTPAHPASQSLCLSEWHLLQPLASLGCSSVFPRGSEARPSCGTLSR